MPLVVSKSWSTALQGLGSGLLEEQTCPATAVARGTIKEEYLDMLLVPSSSQASCDKMLH